MTDATTTSVADGVLVASVWRTGGGSLMRLTMTSPEKDGDVVRTVTTRAEALALVDRWLTALGV